jgi:isopenicillin N synthase-like dioxygenase
LLSGWTKGSLRATLHRVAGPASSNSCSDREVLKEAVQSPRTSVAFFADPNKDVSESLEATAKNQTETTTDFLTGALGGMSVAEYIRWRSGGDDAERSGVSFTAEESEIIHKT